MRADKSGSANDENFHFLQKRIREAGQDAFPKWPLVHRSLDEPPGIAPDVFGLRRVVPEFLNHLAQGLGVLWRDELEVSPSRRIRGPRGPEYSRE